jgi:hypothetical protein
MTTYLFESIVLYDKIDEEHQQTRFSKVDAPALEHLFIHNEWVDSIEEAINLLPPINPEVARYLEYLRRFEGKEFIDDSLRQLITTDGTISLNEVLLLKPCCIVDEFAKMLRDTYGDTYGDQRLACDEIKDLCKHSITSLGWLMQCAYGWYDMEHLLASHGPPVLSYPQPNTYDLVSPQESTQDANKGPLLQE